MPEPDASSRLLIPRPGPDAGALLTAGLRRAGSAPGTTLRWVRLVRDLPSGQDDRALGDGVLVADVRSSTAAEVARRTSLVAALSAESGGFVLSHPLATADPSADSEAAYAGHPLAIEPLGRGADPAQQASGLLEQIAGLSLGVLNLHQVSEQGEATVADASAGSADGPDRLSLAVVAADSGEVRRVLSARPAGLKGWRLLRGATPEAQIPFTMLRAHGPADVLPDSVVRDLAGDVTMYAVALDLPAAPGPGARWLWAGPDRESKTGSADSLASVVQALSGVAAVLGTYPATLAWPSNLPGEPLDEPQ